MVEEVHNLIETNPYCVIYTPLADEVPLTNILPSQVETYALPAQAALDPVEEARKVVQAAAERGATVLVPGRRFDAQGTRHGRGGGWYDRFLRALPTAWLRIGVCFEEQLSLEPLTRESWDEPMDYVVVKQKDGELALYVTNARQNLSSTERP